MKVNEVQKKNVSTKHTSNKSCERMPKSNPKCSSIVSDCKSRNADANGCKTQLDGHKAKDSTTISSLSKYAGAEHKPVKPVVYNNKNMINMMIQQYNTKDTKAVKQLTATYVDRAREIGVKTRQEKSYLNISNNDM